MNLNNMANKKRLNLNFAVKNISVGGLFLRQPSATMCVKRARLTTYTNINRDARKLGLETHIKNTYSKVSSCRKKEMIIQ